MKSVAPTGRKVSRAANVTTTFSETMKAALDQAKPLARGGTYTPTVSTGTEDAAGNALAVAKSWQFTVKR